MFCTPELADNAATDGRSAPSEVTVYPAINAWTFADGTSPEEQIAAAAAAGFGGLELVVAEDGPLRWDTPVSTFAELGARAADAGLRIVSLATGFFWQCNYASAEETLRQRAADVTRRMLERAAAAGAGAILVVPAVVGAADEPRPRVAYADALHYTLEALLTLRHTAEEHAVALAVENVWNRFLLSPVEMCDLIDRANSPYVGVYFDVGNVMSYGYPQDWVATLGQRIARVHVKDYDLRRPGEAGFCPLGAGSVEWPAVIAALRAAGYDGPLTYEGPGKPAEVCRRLEAMLAQPPMAEETP